MQGLGSCGSLHRARNQRVACCRVVADLLSGDESRRTEAYGGTSWRWYSCVCTRGHAQTHTSDSAQSPPTVGGDDVGVYSHFSTLQHTATYCTAAHNTRQYVVDPFSMTPNGSTLCSGCSVLRVAVQWVTVCCSVLQCVLYRHMFV